MAGSLVGSIPIGGDLIAQTIVATVPFICGDGGLDAGEECDDRNRLDGDCCSASCTAEPAGRRCPVGDLCSGFSCDGAGNCIDQPLPACIEGFSRSRLIVKETKVGHEKIIAKMIGSPPLE